MLGEASRHIDPSLTIRVVKSEETASELIPADQLSCLILRNNYGLDSDFILVACRVAGGR